MDYIRNERKRAAFGEAFSEGYGLDGFIRSYVQFTKSYAEIKFLLSLVLGVGISFAIYFWSTAGVYTKSDLPSILSLGLLVGVFIGASFLGQIISNFTSERVSAASKIADCVAKDKKKTAAMCDVEIRKKS